jgi:hypothetical protein
MTGEIHRDDYLQCFLARTSQLYSVIATFSHKLAHNETPTIEVDGDMKLIYVGELVAILAELEKTRVTWSG